MISECWEHRFKSANQELIYYDISKIVVGYIVQPVLSASRDIDGLEKESCLITFVVVGTFVSEVM